ncbi:hypothetical protein EUGRSUZ_I01034 [Eucalyptus grandis]|uniref:Uncharacterized protein n=2 Tax=Eucalyptus grandis TaxID=71139 RepID=A0ACC3JEW7_EUCGR|nr:hypothetical protein EUGRSUZ_I01034 [Eucalyptus grandis]
MACPIGSALRFRILNTIIIWSKASIIFVDSPVGTGFSYSTTEQGWYTSDSSLAEQVHEFLRKWLAEHLQYIAVQLFIGGDSYFGMVVPIVTKYVVDVALRMALISDEFYEAAKTSCNETYVNVDPSNTECWTALGPIKRCVKDLYGDDILEPKFVFASPKENPDLGRRSNFNYALSCMWSHYLRVRKALNVRPRKRSNKSLAYTKDVQSVVEVHKNLSTLGLEVLGECGDCDMVVPFVGMIEWIKRLNLTTVNDWQPWFVDGQVAGYTKKHSEHGHRLTYATVTGAGHPALEYCRRECCEMSMRWVH